MRVLHSAMAMAALIAAGSRAQDFPLPPRRQPPQPDPGPTVKRAAKAALAYTPAKVDPEIAARHVHPRRNRKP